MKNTTLMYERTYSPLGRIQHAKTVRYLLTEECGGAPTYGIKVSERAGDKLAEEEVDGISDSPQKVQRLITFLYENAVPMEAFRDVVEDTIPLLV